MSFRIVESAIDLSEVTRAVTRPTAGAVAVFSGVVRNHNEGRPVTLLEYSAYESMAEKQMHRIGEEIAAEHPGCVLAAHHRVGRLEVGDIAVLCAASAVHRGEAFTACRQLIDRIKHEVPIWKREHGPSGAYWVGWADARCTAHT